MISAPDFASRLLAWYAENGRELPWRETHDPYLIWISEIILQQTRVAQGLAYFQRFTDRFPDVASLAAAGEDEVMKYWQGLGYYSRARNLHAAARQVMERHGGIFPGDHEEVLALKGVGEYTAAAVCSFAWDLPFAVVDGNVYRVLARIFGLDIPTDTTAGRKEFAGLADMLLDRRHPGRYNQAIMDFGALQCTPKQPACPCCPFRDDCRALAEGRTGSLPVRQGRTVVRPRYFNYLDIHRGDVHLLKRREGKDIWQELYEYPLIETEREYALEELQDTAGYAGLLGGAGEVTLVRSVRMPVHLLSHRSIHSVFHDIAVEDFPASLDAFLRVPREELDRYAVSRLIGLYRER